VEKDSIERVGGGMETAGVEEVYPNKSVGEEAIIEGLDTADADARGRGEGELDASLVVDFPPKVCPSIRP
jgi:hypothetical protein